MAAELTWHTGAPGDEMTIHVDWFDENNVHQHTDVVMQILPSDKPRQLRIWINGESETIYTEGGGNRRYVDQPTTIHQADISKEVSQLHHKDLNRGGIGS